MLKTELIKRSPIRILEETIHGGLGKGCLGVFTARKGVGKTASMVHVATDKMLREQNVIHISFADDPQHIGSWYKQVFQEVSRQNKLDHANEIYEDLLHRRLILHFKQKDVSFSQIKDNFYQITKSASFTPQTIFVDGFPFEEATPEQLKEWQQFALDLNVEIWFSATMHRHNLQLDEKGIPAPVNRFTDLFSVIIVLDPKEDYIDFKLLKAHSFNNLDKLRLKLDPQTLLIANHRV
ncbi:hypothetical protein JXQ31_03785 [candidate division KSB1 bacterium]|nr:hypothetical protein [candidate division KSB1 bacterium]